MGSYFVDAGLVVEELTTRGPPLMKKKKAKSKRKMVYKYSRARKLFANLWSMHSMEEMQELLVGCVKFLDLGMMKIEVFSILYLALII